MCWVKFKKKKSLSSSTKQTFPGQTSNLKDYGYLNIKCFYFLFSLDLFVLKIPSSWSFFFLIYFKIPVAQGNLLMQSTLKCLRPWHKLKWGYFILLQNLTAVHFLAISSFPMIKISLSILLVYNRFSTLKKFLSFMDLNKYHWRLAFLFSVRKCIL